MNNQTYTVAIPAENNETLCLILIINYRRLESLLQAYDRGSSQILKITHFWVSLKEITNSPFLKSLALKEIPQVYEGAFETENECEKMAETTMVHEGDCLVAFTSEHLGIDLPVKTVPINLDKLCTALLENTVVRSELAQAVYHAINKDAAISFEDDLAKGLIYVMMSILQKTKIPVYTNEKILSLIKNAYPNPHALIYQFITQKTPEALVDIRYALDDDPTPVNALIVETCNKALTMPTPSAKNISVVMTLKAIFFKENATLTFKVFINDARTLMINTGISHFAIAPELILTETIDKITSMQRTLACGELRFIEIMCG